MTLSLSRGEKERVVIPDLRVARTYPQRLIGLLGTDRLESDKGLLIKNCNSIHTFFMKYPIDVLFVDDTYEVVKALRSFKPFRVIFAGAKVRHVIELAEGIIEKFGIKCGERLMVRN